MKVRKVLRYVPVLLALAALMALPLLPWVTPAQGSAPAQSPFASGRILVKFQPGTSPADQAALHRALGGQAIRRIPGIGVEVVRIPPKAEEARADAYARSPLVAYAEPDYVAHALGDPDDTDFSKQWGLDNDGQVYKDSLSGMADADIDAPEAWDITTGTATVSIAILDTGIDQDHPDLDDKLKGNINFTDSSTADDLYGHGTHVAGIAAAETNNAQGVAGVGYNTSLLNVKVLNDQGSGAYFWIANGIVWATDHGAKVINMSLGGSRKSRTLEDAVNYAWNNGVVLACAGGNSGNSSPTYPAKYDNCIAVAATDANDQKASWSSYSSKWMDVAAPGVDIFSTFPYHDFVLHTQYGKSYRYDYGSGTSMATPFVSGLAALVWATPYGTDNSAVRARIETTADAIPGTGTYWTYGRINACNAVGGSCAYAGVQPPPVPSGSMYVWDIAWNPQQRGPNYHLEVTVTVRWDSDGDGVAEATDDPVSNASVVMTLTYQDGTSWNFSGTTDSAGQVTFKLIKAQAGTYTAQVTGLTHTTLTWDSTLDADNPDTFAF